MSIMLLTITLSACDSRKSSQESIESVQVLIEEGNKAEAIINLKNVLKNDTKNAEARFLLGKLYAQQGNWLAAEKELNRAQRYFFDTDLVLPLLANVYSHLNDRAGIETLLTKDSKISDDTRQEIQYFLAVSSLASKDGSELAKIEFKNLIKNDKTSIYSHLSRSWLYSLEKNFDKGLKVVEKLLIENTNNALIIELKARTLFTANKMDLAAETYKQYLGFCPQDHHNRLMYSLALANASKFIEAEKQADLLLEINKSNPLVNQVKAQARFSAKDYGEAKKYAEIAINSVNLPIARIVAGFSAYQLQQPELAYDHLVVVKDILSYQHPAKKLLSAIRFQLGYEEENFSELSKAPLSELDSNFLTLSAKELFKVGKTKKAVELMQRASDLDSENSSIIYQQGLMSLFSGDDSSITLFKKALDKSPDLNAASLMLVMKLVEKKEYKEALDVAIKLEEKKPEFAYGLMGGIYNAQGDLKTAKMYFQKILKLNKQNIVALFNLAKVSQAENNFKQSINIFQQIIEIDNQHIPSLLEMLKLADKQSLQTEVEQFFESRALTNRENVTSVIALAEYYLIKNNVEKAKNLIQQSLVRIPNTKKLLMEEAKIEILLKNYDLALISIDKALVIDDENSVAHAARANLLLLKGDLLGAIKEQEVAVILNKNSFNLKLQLAFLYLKNNQIKAAKNVEKELFQNNKNNIAYNELQGKVAFIEKDYSKALAKLTPVYENKPSDGILLLLVTSLHNLDKTSEALQMLSIFEGKASEPLSIQAQLKQAELYSKASPLKAIKIYEGLINTTDNEIKYILFNNLAWLHLGQGDNSKALGSAEEAIKLSPNTSAIHDTYSSMLLANGNSVKALAFSKKAYQANKLKQNYKLHYAEALLANDKKNEAKKLIDSIKSTDLVDDELVRFKSVLKKL